MQAISHFRAGPFLAAKSRNSNLSLLKHHSDGHSSNCAKPIWMSLGQTRVSKFVCFSIGPISDEQQGAKVGLFRKCKN